MDIKDERSAVINRKTTETSVSLNLALNSTDLSEIDTGVGFLDHMLDLFAKHSGMKLKLHVLGDLEVDAHHTVEDVGICLGQALKTALGDKSGIERYGHVLLPMDEALVAVALDLSGRAYLAFDLPLPTAKVGDFDTELAEEFFRAFASNASLTLHVRLLAGKNTHHIMEAAFKGLGRALRLAVEIKDPHSGLPSTKGLL